MRRIHRLLQFLALTIILASGWLVADRQVLVKADAANAPSLTISQLKITSSDGQFITLYNATDGELDMSKYQLEYFNNYDLRKATAGKVITLSGTVPPHGYYMISDDSLELCYQLTVDSASLGFSSTAGLVEVLAFDQVSPGASAPPTLEDYVGWSKATANDAVTLPVGSGASLLRQPLDGQGNPLVEVPGDGSWQAVQPSATNPCQLVTAGSSDDTRAPVNTGLSQLLPGSEPPASIVPSASGGAAAASIPAHDIGLMAPKITELLPNPAGTGNDGTNEFIELYNPNGTTFDLSGFVLQTGTTSFHVFTFPAGTELKAKSFKALYSAQTHASLSNTAGQAKLLDPLGRSVAASDVYEKAKDGQTWALAKGKWYWTTKPTPSAANVISAPATSKSKASKAKSAGGTAAGVSGGGATGTDTSSSETAAVTPIHSWTLVTVGGLALLYGAYEYRGDMANRFYQFRRHLAARRADRA